MPRQGACISDARHKQHAMFQLRRLANSKLHECKNVPPCFVCFCSIPCKNFRASSHPAPNFNSNILHMCLKAPRMCILLLLRHHMSPDMCHQTRASRHEFTNVRASHHGKLGTARISLSSRRTVEASRIHWGSLTSSIATGTFTIPWFFGRTQQRAIARVRAPNEAAKFETCVFFVIRCLAPPSWTLSFFVLDRKMCLQTIDVALAWPSEPV